MRLSREGTCSVSGCHKPIKAKRLCEMHYARQLRYGTLEKNTVSKEEIPTCIAIECNEPTLTRGLCTYHYNNFKETGSPYTPFIIKVCSIPSCDDIHRARGLCQYHYNEWLKIAESKKLSPFKERKPNGKNHDLLMK